MLIHPAKRINEASQQIVNGEYEGAIATLTNTLKTCKLILSGDAKIGTPNKASATIKEQEPIKEDTGEEDSHLDQVDNDGLKHSSSSDSTTSVCLEYDFFASPSSSFLETDVTTKDHEDCSTLCCNGSNLSIFREPILVICDDNFEAPLDIRACEELSYVAIYNIALAHHLMSVQLSRQIQQKDQQEKSSSSILKQEIYLRKALSLYEHCRQILTNRTIQVGRSFVNTLAFTTNVRQIHYALGNHRLAKMYAQSLLLTMMRVIDCDEVDALGDSADGFLEILISKHGDDSAPAA